MIKDFIYIVKYYKIVNEITYYDNDLSDIFISTEILDHKTKGYYLNTKYYSFRDKCFLYLLQRALELLFNEYQIYYEK
jgi:hypothetical protein